MFGWWYSCQLSGNIDDGWLCCCGCEGWEVNHGAVTEMFVMETDLHLHHGNLTWNPNIEVWKMNFLFNWVIFKFQVNCQGCRIAKKNSVVYMQHLQCTLATMPLARNPEVQPLGNYQQLVRRSCCFQGWGRFGIRNQV